jgi:hypothetical protein
MIRQESTDIQRYVCISLATRRLRQLFRGRRLLAGSRRSYREEMGRQIAVCAAEQGPVERFPGLVASGDSPDAREAFYYKDEIGQTKRWVDWRENSSRPTLWTGLTL